MRKLIILILCISFFFSIPSPTFAVDMNTESSKTVYQEDTVDSEFFRDPNLVGETLPASVEPRGNYGERTVISDVFYSYPLVIVEPEGQPSGGYAGGSGATVFFFSSGGKSHKFTLTIDYKNFTFTAETGSESSSGSGYGAKVPGNPGAYKFQFKKYYTIKTTKIDVYLAGDVYSHSFYRHESTYTLSHEWKKIG